MQAPWVCREAGLTGEPENWTRAIFFLLLFSGSPYVMTVLQISNDPP
jgi:hypothetical protein